MAINKINAPTITSNGKLRTTSSSSVNSINPSIDRDNLATTGALYAIAGSGKGALTLRIQEDGQPTSTFNVQPDNANASITLLMKYNTYPGQNGPEGVQSVFQNGNALTVGYAADLINSDKITVQLDGNGTFSSINIVCTNNDVFDAVGDLASPGGGKFSLDHVLETV